MGIESQWLWIEKSSSAASAPTGAKSDWFLVVPARFGGSAITVTVASAAAQPSQGTSLELKSESQGRIRATQVEVQDGRTKWSWPAPEGSQLCRLFIKTANGAEGVDPRAPLLVEQLVDDTSGERVVLVVEGQEYQSKLMRIIGHGDAEKD